MPLKPGSIVVFANKSNAFFSVMQRWFTHQWIDGISPKKFIRGNKTHTAIVWYPQAGDDALLEASLCTTVTPWSHHVENTKYWVFEPVGFIDGQIKEALEETYLKYAGSSYGFGEILWFVYRFYMESLFHKDVRKQHTFFPGGDICSQLGWNFLYSLGKYRPRLRDLLDQWRSTTFHSSDSFTVMLESEGIYKLTEQQL